MNMGIQLPPEGIANCECGKFGPKHQWCW